MTFLLSNIQSVLKVAKELSETNSIGVRVGGQQNWKLALQLLSISIYIAKEIKEYELIYGFIKLYGKINQISDRIKRAIETFEMLREVAYEGDNPKQIMEAYHLLGIVL